MLFVFYFLNKSYERSILADKYMSKRDKFDLNANDSSSSWLFEHFFVSTDDENREKKPLAIKITTDGQKNSSSQHYALNLYEFDTSIDETGASAFDLSQCVAAKRTRHFAIKFNSLPNNDELNAMAHSIESDHFYTLLASALKNMSMLRILKPHMQTNLDGFVIFAGLTDYPPPLGNVNSSIRDYLSFLITVLQTHSHFRSFSNRAQQH